MKTVGNKLPTLRLFSTECGATLREPVGCPTFLQDRYVQDERYFAIEHMDVRREASQGPHMCPASPGSQYRPRLPTTDNTVGQQ